MLQAVFLWSKYMSGMRISDNGIIHLQQSEGSRLKAYRDQTGKLTIGFGHTGTVNGVPIHNGMKITKEQEAELLKQDIGYFEDYVNRKAKKPMTQNQFDAIVSLAFNVGEGNLNKSSFWGHFNAGNTDLAAETILSFNKSKNEETKQPEFNQGLMNRRLREKALFLGDDASSSLYQTSPQQDKQLITQPNIPTNPILAAYDVADKMASTFTPATQPLNSLGALEPLNTLDQLTEPQPAKPNYREQYQNQLANAFGVEPEMKNAIPDYIGDLVRSIYDQT